MSEIPEEAKEQVRAAVYQAANDWTVVRAHILGDAPDVEQWVANAAISAFLSWVKDNPEWIPPGWSHVNVEEARYMDGSSPTFVLERDDGSCIHSHVKTLEHLYAPDSVTKERVYPATSKDS